MKDNPTYPIDSESWGIRWYVIGIPAILKNGVLTTDHSGVVEARMLSQGVQPTCLWALTASEAGKPERLTFMQLVFIQEEDQRATAV